jgi:hypothetical protein
MQHHIPIFAGYNISYFIEYQLTSINIGAQLITCHKKHRIGKNIFEALKG